MYGLISHGARELLRMQERPKRTKRLRLSRRFRQRIYWRDSGKCVYCDRAITFKDATMDHVTPLVRKGKARSKENVALACTKCNRKKEQLVMDDLQDLSPNALCAKFDKVARDTAARAGHYRDWISKFDKAAAVSS